MATNPNEIPVTEEPTSLEAGEVQATDQEQAQFESAYNEALNVIHGDGQVGDQIASMVLESQNVAQGIGNATSAVIIAVENKAGQIPEDMRVQLGQEIITELSSLAVEAGALSEDEVDEGFLDAVVSTAYSSYLSTKESMGQLNPQELEQDVAAAEQMTGRSARQGQAQQPQPQSATQGGLMSMGG